MSSATIRGDLTRGPITSKIILYSIPLLLGNLLQQLYTMADSIIVGNWVGKEALAAVGATSSIVNTLVAFFMGTGVGVTVVVSQYYGARDLVNLRRAIHSTILLTLATGIICTLLGIALTPAMLRLMDTPADVYDQAYEYLTIYFAGIIGLVFYNMLTGVLRAMGDSRRPLYFLIFSCILNIGLDALFVIVFHWGVAGAAWATVLSQLIAVAALLWLMCTTGEEWKADLRQLHLHPDILKKVFNVGLPIALNSTLISLSNVVVTSFINAFGSDCMAGWSAFLRIQNLASLPMQSLTMAATTFVGQNYGAGRYDRIRKGNRITAALSGGCVAVIGVLMILFRYQLTGLFNRDPGVLEYGSIFILSQAPFLWLEAVRDSLAGTLRGLGDAKMPVLTAFCAYVIFRQLYLHLLTPHFHNIWLVSLGFPLAWFTCLIMTALYYPYKCRQLLGPPGKKQEAGCAD